MNKKEFKIWNDRYGFIKWRWEFMRLDPKYLADYKKVLKLRKKAKYPPGHKIEIKKGMIEYPYFLTPEGLKEKECCVKYGFAEPLLSMPDPKQSWKELIGGEPEFDGKKPMSHLQAWAHITAGWLIPRGVTVSNKPDDKTRININIDFEKINSIAALKEHVAFLIQQHFDLRIKREMPDRKQSYSTGYDIILQVGIMKEKKKMTQAQIAKVIFPRAFKPESINANADAVVNATRDVGHIYKRYKELVNGGYKNLTYP